MIQIMNPVPQLTVLEGFAIDINLEDNIRMSNRLPTYPTEKGYDLGAFAGQELMEYRISGLNSKTPILPFKAFGDALVSNWLAMSGTKPDSIGAKTYLKQTDILKFTYQWFADKGGFTIGEDIKNLYRTKKPQPLVITNKYGTHHLMYIDAIDLPRNAMLGEAIQFDVLFKQLPEITNQTVFLKNAGETNDAGTENAATKSKEKTTSTQGEKRKSTFKNGKDNLGPGMSSWINNLKG